MLSPMRFLVAALIALTSAQAAAQEGASTTVEGDAPEEAESHIPQPLGPALLYTRELTDQDLAKRFRDDLPSLGSIAVGFADRGRVLNAVQMPRDPAWIVERPNLSFATRETVEALALAFRSVRREFPDSAPGRLSHVGARDGGYLRPHRSHQNGRDADIGFYYRNDRIPPRGVSREKLMDPARNWALLRALITETDVQVILVDRRIQPLLAMRPDQNLVVHVVRQGNTLGQIASRYKTSVVAIRQVNRMKGKALLQLGQHLVIPLRGPCTQCPLPPPVAVPPRLQPPEPLPSIAQSWLGGINPEMATAE
jgi:hypothetical protein